MAQMLKNKFVHARNGLDFSRSLFPYEKRHSTNLLAGYIVPVHTQFLYPGMSPDYDFGCVVESAPLISTNLDNIYADIVCIWSPIRLVMTDWNEFLGESHTQAFTINRNITIPKVSTVDNGHVPLTISGSTVYPACSRAYIAEHRLGVHFGFRYHGTFSNTAVVCPADSIFYKGISVLPSRIYENNWNTFFRNENVQAPILIDKTSTLGTHDLTYTYGLGSMQIANKLRTFYTVATPAPSLLDVSIGLGESLPVGFIPSANETSSSIYYPGLASGSVILKDEFLQFGLVASGSNNGSAIIANTALLTVNKMFYALMEQRFANKLMKGRRAVEFYKNFFGIETSDAGHDLPQLICQKRYPLNISQVIATANSTDIDTNTQPIGSKGAYSVTGFGGNLIKNFLATEHGYLQTYMIIRGQPSLAAGIDKHLGYDTLLDTYLPEFDHIGPVGIEALEVSEPYFASSSIATMFGYTNAWYQERKQVSDVVGIMEPDEPLAYKTLALSYISTTGGFVISDSFLRFNPKIIDRIFLWQTQGLGTSNTWVDNSDHTLGAYDENGEPTMSNRYQFLTQFVVKGKLAAVMSPDSEPLQLRL